MEAVQNIMPKGRLGIAREGYPFIILSVILTFGTYFISPWFAVPFGLAVAFCLYFFRDPERQVPSDAKLLVSPADGTVLKIEQLEDSPLYSGPHQKISIFMSALNVHVNRIPCDGVVTGVKYHPGKFFVASLDKASEHNERCSVTLETPQGKRVAFTQIAGLVARRIVCYLEGGHQVRRGERYGIIRFGSRMEVSLPQGWEILVKKGDKIHSTETPLARMKD